MQPTFILCYNSSSKIIYEVVSMEEQTKPSLTQEQKLQARAEKLRQNLAKANKQLAQIQAKKQTEERRKRTRKLINVGGIFAMISDKLIETEANATLYRLVLGTALQLNELIDSNDENAKSRLSTLESKAKQFLDSRTTAQ
jgi:regulator of protease activity HflC (stomatin/prohibitin superfamily)